GDGAARPGAAGRRRRGTGGLDGRRERADQPGRNVHEAVRTMNPLEEKLLGATRRQFLQNCSVGLGALALGSVLGRGAWAQEAENPLAARSTHFNGRAKRVIYLHMAGSPPHLDLLDYKPELVTPDGQD